MSLDDITTHDDVYEPAEDSQLLLDTLTKREPALTGMRAADVGTGTGVIARALARAGARVVAIDVNPVAANVARGNLAGTPAAGRVIRGDLLSAVRGPFEVITFNAPYLPSAEEERVTGWLDHAFHGGEGGVEVSARFVRDLPRTLAPGGRAYLVVSSRADLEGLRTEASRAGLDVVPVGSTRFFFEEVSVWRLEKSAIL